MPERRRIRPGEAFGRLTADQDLGRAGDGSTLWRLTCSCGDWTTASSAELRAGGVASCGECRRGWAPWTEAEEDILRQHYPDATMAELMAMIDRTDPAITNRVRVLGLSKSTAFWARPDTGRIQPGNVPPNKGRKGMAAHPNAVRTQFKPGNKPQTWQPIGTETLDRDGYLKRKVRDDDDVPSRFNWEYVHRMVWGAEHGPIPEGHAVCFRNDDKTDIRPENLELVSRDELMLRNSVHQYPPEVVQVVQLRGALNRKIRRHERRLREEQDV